ncbi:MAG: hypothetical protein IJV96_05335 [Clostridia bacterium]|nr:hypothetical protein [Clostridia bacterium]
MKEQDPITRACAYCQHARFTCNGANEAPPLVRLLDTAEDSEDTTVTCPYKKNVSPFDGCRRFRFDPVKYRPKPKPSPVSLSEDDIL